MTNRLQNSRSTSNRMAVYPRFSECIIPSQNVSDKWERVVGLDVGYRNPTAMVIGAIDPQTGNVHIFKEYYKANTLVPEHARNMKQILEECKVTAGNTRYMVIDPSAVASKDPVNGKSVQSLYQEYGMYFSPANNNIEAGVLKVNAYIELGRLKVHDTCPNLIREMLNYQYPDVEDNPTDRNVKEKPIKNADHSADALRYLLMRLPDDPNNLKNSSHNPPNRYIMEEDEDDLGQIKDFLSYV